MCFQGFATCACGHIVLVENTCELAADVPFYIKVACPNYTYSSKTTGNRACGSQGFYCRETKVGQFLEQAHCIAVQAQAQLNQIDIQSEPVEVQAAKLNTAADIAGVSQEARRLHAAWQPIFWQLEALERKREEVTQRRMVALTVLQEGMKYYRVRSIHSRKKDGSAPPPFTLPASLRPILPEALQIQLDVLVRHDKATSTELDPRLVEVDCGISDQNAQLRRGSPENDKTYLTPKKVGNPVHDLQKTPDVLPPQDNSFVVARGNLGSSPWHKHTQQVKQLNEDDGEQEDLNASGQKCGLSKKSDQVKESSIIRRSARVRDKKVSYAESETSTVLSREPSPERKPVRRRSKVPSMRNETITAGDSKVRRSNTTMSSMIDEWNRRTIATRSARQEMFQSTGTTYNSLRQVSGLPNINNASANSKLQYPGNRQSQAQSKLSVGDPVANSLSRWEFSSVPAYTTPNQYSTSTPAGMGIPPDPGMTNYSSSTPSHFLSSPYQSRIHASHASRTEVPNIALQNNHLQTPLGQQRVNRTWLINTPSFDSPMAQASARGRSQSNSEMRSPHEGNNRKLGVAMHGGAIPAPELPPLDRDYDHMRRSFNSTAELNPPASVNPTSTSTDRQKRSLPAPSPLSSSKHIRLSLPDENTKSGIQNPFVSSPKKLSFPTPLPNDISPGKLRKEPNAEPPVTPAPMLAPVAVMYAPSQQAKASQTTNFATTADTLGVRDTVEGVADDMENQFSNIDWSLLNDDFL